jgi:hypothetical protein
MKTLCLAIVMLTHGLNTGTRAEPESKPTKPGIKEVEAWLVKDTIVKIRESITLPFRAAITPAWMKVAEKPDSSVFQIDGIDMNDLDLVATAIARRGDLNTAPVWKECLNSTQTHIRFVASECLMNIYGGSRWFRGFDYESDPASKRGTQERERFLDLLAVREPPLLPAAMNPRVKEVEAWITKETIQKICDACAYPFFPAIGSGQTFEIGGERISEGDLMQVARAISMPENWLAVPMWESA